MNLLELVTEFERRCASALRDGSTAQVAQVYKAVIEDLRRVNGVQAADRFLDSKEAAEILGVHPRTVARWCNTGKFLGAWKTSRKGEWRIPSAEVYRISDRSRDRTAPRPKLWKEGTDG